MRISVENRLEQVIKKEDQRRQREILVENQASEVRRRLDSRRFFIVGQLFCKHFPIALEIVPGKTVEEDRLNFEGLDNLMEAMEKCLECYQEIENALLEKG